MKLTAEESSCSVGLYFTEKLQSGVDGKLIKPPVPRLIGTFFIALRKLILDSADWERFAPAGAFW